MESSDQGLAAGLALGQESRVGRKVSLAVEAFARISGADELSTTLLGVGVSVIPIGASGGTHE